jgi:hypothetical protein
MALYAVTNIDSGDKFIAAGDTVKSNDFDKDTLEHLKEIGSVAEEKTRESLEPDERDAKIAELEAKLAELQNREPVQTGTPQATATPSKAASSTEAKK